MGKPSLLTPARTTVDSTKESMIVKPDLKAFAPSSQQPHLYGGRRAALQLHVLIVGCGLGGLAAAHCLAQAGHRVTMLESAPALGEVGAGIQVSPNVSRLLLRWGLADQLEQLAVMPEAICFRRYSTGERVGYTRWGKGMTTEHGAPYYHIHRADFHQLLYNLVKANSDVKIRLNATVTKVDAETPAVTLQTGEVVTADVLIGADGVKSVVQQAVLGEVIPATPTGDAAYRAIIPTSVMLADPELAPLVHTPEMTGWMAPGRHLMGYNIRSKREYNVVLLHPDDGSVESWTSAGSADRMRADFADFEPRIGRLLSHVNSTLKWRLMDRRPLRTWVHPAGRTALLGDSCHPMLPYRAQGAAMAIEDAAVLGNLFSRLSSPNEIEPLLRAYQSLRYARTAATQASSRLNQKTFHLEDGPEQEKRDADMRTAMAAELGFAPAVSTAGNANQWADKEKNKAQFGYDADVVADVWWAEHGEDLVAQREEAERLTEAGRKLIEKTRAIEGDESQPSDEEPMSVQLWLAVLVAVFLALVGAKMG